MGAFAGTHVFDLSIDGTRRRYLGPAVIGVGQSLGESAMWGQGIWPVFGHAFQSYAFSARDKQLTGGRFADGGNLVAQIAGIARPANDGNWPELTGPFAAAELATSWYGERRTFLPDGRQLSEEAIERVYQDESWQEQSKDSLREASVEFFEDRLLAQVRQTEELFHGVSRRYGWLLEHDWASSTGAQLRGFEALDSTDRELIGMFRRYQDHQLERIEVIHLRPQETT